jgi:hypothetical protein
MSPYHHAVMSGTGSYEDLLALDRSVRTPGLNEVQRDEYTVTQDLTEADLGRLKDKACTICLDEFEAGATIRRLPCLDIFHKQCIDTHFDSSKVCPNCRTNVIVDEQ